MDRQFLDFAIQSIWNEFSLKPLSLDITNCIQFKAYASVSNNFNSRTNRRLQDTSEGDMNSKMYFSKFKMDCLVLDCLVSLTPISKPSLVSSVLVKSLETREFHLSRFTDLLSEFDNESDIRTGYMNLTESGQISLHLDTDPTVLSSSPIGIWISGIKNACDFRVWKACLQFILASNAQMNSENDASMLLGVYGNSGVPHFYRTAFVPSHETDLCNSFSVFIAFNRHNTEPIQFKFTLLSSREVCTSSSRSKASEYFTWDLVKKTPDNKKELAALKDSVKQFCNSVHGLQYSQGEVINQATFIPCSTKSETSIVPKPKNWNNTTNSSTFRSFDDEFKSLDFSGSHIPEASLLFEESVKTSYSNLGGNRTCQITSEQLHEESLPREPPRKSNGSLKIDGVSNNCFIQEDVTEYDPSRYQNSCKPETKSSPVHMTLPQDTEYKVNKNDQKSTFSEILPAFDDTNTTVYLQNILSNLPFCQLERLEQIITVILNKDNSDHVKEDPHRDSLDCENDQDTLHKNNLKKGISVGVNTTFLTSDTNLKHKEKVSDFGSFHSNQIDQSLPTIISTANDEHETRYQDNNIHQTHVKTVDTKVTSSPIFKVTSTSQVKEETKMQLDSQRQNDTVDKYSLLLANIQQVLNNRVSCDSLSSVSHQNNQKLMSSDNQKAQIHSEELPASNSIPAALHQQNNFIEYNLTKFKNPERVNQRVSSWLSSDPNSVYDNQPSPSAEVGDAVLPISSYLTRTQSHTSDRFPPTNQVNSNHKYEILNPLHNMHTNKVKQQDRNLLMSVFSSDTNQSLYLASLVNKYLGPELLDSTREGSMEIDYSMATLDYMKRHGIIEDFKSDESKSDSPPVSSTPTTYRKNASMKYARHYTRQNDCIHPLSIRPSSSIPFAPMAPKSSDLQASLTIGESLPNLLNGLRLDQSHVTQHVNITNTDIKYLSTLSDSTLETCNSNSPILPVSDYAHITDYTSSVINNPILDLERLRSLPKLL
ncbi:unnamed protein product [Heterobilharzia americana]|nr:unnamed protein product [Heterobilharzia americana]